MAEILNSLTTDDSVNKVLQGVSESEEIAEDILGDRGLIVELERRKNALREASRALERGDGDKVWILNGPFFVKMKTKDARDLIRRDTQNISHEVESIRNKLKVKVDKLRDVENQPNLKGFNLKPLSRNELAALGTTPRS
ncbi:p53 and DNA damage-regulated protein 1-like [Ischnura elegans]|uniref:p53 and DNA damage-regulated protein 1-like n=1 Tax=Ischnura elegans TaxID=197161 RepID=UPI001ED89764|nr:p53 and DNA damage-regulated protein 1-like [Ischnura elegans]